MFLNIVQNKTHQKQIKSSPVWIEEISHNEFLQFLSVYFAVSVLIDDLNVWSDVSCCWLELFVHCSVAIDQPFCNFDWFTYSVSIAVICLDDFPFLLMKKYLARFLHYSRENNPPFSTRVWLVSKVVLVTWLWANCEGNPKLFIWNLIFNMFSDYVF